MCELCEGSDVAEYERKRLARLALRVERLSEKIWRLSKGGMKPHTEPAAVLKSEATELGIDLLKEWG